MFRQTFHTARLVSVALVALLGTEAVRAQAEARTGFELEEIIVTARKREENLQTTPVSISAFTETELRNRQIESTDRLSDITPNLIFDSVSPASGSSSSAQIIIRESFNPITYNGGTADIDGGELELTWVPTGRWYLTAAVGYIDAGGAACTLDLASGGTLTPRSRCLRTTAVGRARLHFATSRTSAT